MNRIVLKTAKRKTTVSRIKVRQAVAALYAGKITIPPAQKSIIIKAKKETSPKKVSKVFKWIP